MTKKKITIILTILIIGINGFGQKLQKILDKNDAEKFEQYIAAGWDLNEGIQVEFEEKGKKVTAEVSPLIYILGKEYKEVFDVHMKHLHSLPNAQDLVTEAFVYSLSLSDDYFAEKLNGKSPSLEGQCDVCHGNTAMMAAATYGKERWYFELKTLSLQDVVNKNGATIFHAAVSGENEKILDDLLTKKVMVNWVNKPDNEGETPLDYAMSSSNFNVVHQLLKNNAEPTKAKHLLMDACIEFNMAFFDLKDYDVSPTMFYKEAWTADEDVLPIMNACFEDEQTDKFITDSKNTQALFVKECLKLMKESLSTAEGRAVYDTAEEVSEQAVLAVWDFCNYYLTTTAKTFGENSNEYTKAEEQIKSVLTDMAELHFIVEDFNDVFISKASYDYAIKWIGADLVSEYLGLY